MIRLFLVVAFPSTDTCGSSGLGVPTMDRQVCPETSSMGSAMRSAMRSPMGQASALARTSSKVAFVYNGGGLEDPKDRVGCAGSSILVVALRFSRLSVVMPLSAFAFFS